MPSSHRLTNPVTYAHRNGVCLKIQEMKLSNHLATGRQLLPQATAPARELVVDPCVWCLVARSTDVTVCMY